MQFHGSLGELFEVRPHLKDASDGVSKVSRSAPFKGKYPQNMDFNISYKVRMFQSLTGRPEACE